MPDKTQELDAPMYSTTQLSQLAREAFSQQFNRRDEGVERAPYSWIRDVYIGHPRFGNAVVAERQGLMYLVAMDLTGERPTFAALDQWRVVRPTYEFVQTETDQNVAGAEELPVLEMDADLEESLDLWTAQPLDISEAAGATSRDPLSIRFVMIKPGFGNSRDNHYYPAEVLRRDAHKFVGAKMYATDHRPEQRSVLTEVAVVDRIAGFTDDGGPIGEATIWGPAFAEQVRNRSKANKLHLLECSILGKGRAKRGMVDGRKAKIIQEIAEGRAVDWVSRAGAGGHALDISESDSNGGTDMGDDKAAEEEETTQVEDDVKESDAETEVVIQEQSDDKGEQLQETKTEKKEDTPAQEATLGQDTVNTLLQESGLGETARDILSRGTYATETTLTAAIEEMQVLLKTASRAGKPFAQGASEQPSTPPKDDTEWWADMAEKYGLQWTPAEEKR